MIGVGTFPNCVAGYEANCERQKPGQTDRRTDERTDKVSYRGACYAPKNTTLSTRSKTLLFHYALICRCWTTPWGRGPRPAPLPTRPECYPRRNATFS